MILLLIVVMILFLLSKLYVPIITLPERHNQELSKLFSKGFERLL